jgi:hypothetical protein
VWRKRNHLTVQRQSAADHFVDYLAIEPQSDHKIDQQNDYSALNHFLERSLIDTHCRVISTECQSPPV